MTDQPIENGEATLGHTLKVLIAQTGLSSDEVRQLRLSNLHLAGKEPKLEFMLEGATEPKKVDLDIESHRALVNWLVARPDSVGDYLFPGRDEAPLELEKVNHLLLEVPSPPADEPGPTSPPPRPGSGSTGPLPSSWPEGVPPGVMPSRPVPPTRPEMGPPRPSGGPSRPVSVPPPAPPEMGAPVPGMRPTGPATPPGPPPSSVPEAAPGIEIPLPTVVPKTPAPKRSAQPIVPPVAEEVSSAEPAKPVATPATEDAPPFVATEAAVSEPLAAQAPSPAEARGGPPFESKTPPSAEDKTPAPVESRPSPRPKPTAPTPSRPMPVAPKAAAPPVPGLHPAAQPKPTVPQRFPTAAEMARTEPAKAGLARFTLPALIGIGLICALVCVGGGVLAWRSDFFGTGLISVAEIPGSAPTEEGVVSPEAVVADSPLPTPTLPPTQTPPPLPTDTPAPTEPPAPEATEAPEATDTPEPTDTPETTDTPEPTATNTPQAADEAAEPEPTEEVIPTPTPGLKYGAPVLVEPKDGFDFINGNTIVLQWQPVGELAPDEQYAVRLVYRFNSEVTYQGANVTEPQWTVPLSLYGQVDPPENFYEWFVVVERVNNDGSGTAISPESSKRSFTWK